MSTENLESQQIRELSEAIPDTFTVKLPALTPDKWCKEGLLENCFCEFVDVNLSELLGFIADMAE